MGNRQRCERVGRGAGTLDVVVGILSERYHALADEAEQAMSMLGNRPTEDYAKQGEPRG